MNDLQLSMAECLPEFVDCGNLSDASDDDVVFVKQFDGGEKENKPPESTNSKRTNNQGTPRRNPARTARTTRRFKDFTDGSIVDSEFFDESTDREEETATVEETPPKRGEDAEEWTVETDLKRSKQKKKRMPYKYTRGGRRKGVDKKNVPEEKKKVNLRDLEDLMTENLLLTKTYVDNVTFLSSLQKDGAEEGSVRINSAKEILKQQVLLLAVTKDIADVDVLKCLNE